MKTIRAIPFTAMMGQSGTIWVMDISGVIDNIMINPMEAQVIAFDYDPLVGMTSQTDAKGMTTYYEYDAFQRLKAVKDQNFNILKQTDYHYKN